MTSTRIFAHLQKKGRDQVPRVAAFTECVVDYFEEKNSGETTVCAWLENNSLIISDDVTTKPNKSIIKHPSFCPIKHLSSQPMELPESTLSRGINTGTAIILESADGKVLLTKRAAHLHAFPNIWVPPGGHLEVDETLAQAGLRELHEETGLEIKESYCVRNHLELLALWESVYPPRLSLGPPKRHHIVVYLHAKLKQPHTADALFLKLKFDPGEVSACAWLDRKVIEAIVKSDEETVGDVHLDSTLPETIKASVLDSAQNQIQADISLKPFFNRSQLDEDCERVSTGTKYALEKFLCKKSSAL